MEEHITSIFRAKNQPTQKPPCSRWLCRWKWCVPLKRQFACRLHGATSQKVATFISYEMFAEWSGRRSGFSLIIIIAQALHVYLSQLSEMCSIPSVTSSCVRYRFCLWLDTSLVTEWGSSFHLPTNFEFDFESKRQRWIYSCAIKVCIEVKFHFSWLWCDVTMKEYRAFGTRVLAHAHHGSAQWLAWLLTLFVTGHDKVRALAYDGFLCHCVPEHTTLTHVSKSETERQQPIVSLCQRVVREE
jgi:hypothetical protein